MLSSTLTEDEYTAANSTLDFQHCFGNASTDTCIDRLKEFC